jgi:pyruvate kinase
MLDLLCTLWPSFGHFPRFMGDRRLAGVRMNSAMITVPELDRELASIHAAVRDAGSMPLFFDVKGRQMRVTEVHENESYLDITLNHPITVKTPTEVLFKAGADFAVLDHLEEGGKRLIFQGGPRYNVFPGESLHIRHHSLAVHGSIFTEAEIQKIAMVKQAGITRWFLSYVECQQDVDLFCEMVGQDAEVWLKIESQKGLNYVAQDFVKQPNLVLVEARGDLYVELEHPHEILAATKLILAKDPEACVGSRLLLSVVNEPVPSCADWSELAWLADLGYKRMMLCDELCLKEDLLSTAVNAFDAFRQNYGKAET